MPVPKQLPIPNPITQVKIPTHELNKENVPYCVVPNNRVNIGVVIKAIPCKVKVLIMLRNVILLTDFFIINKSSCHQHM